MQSPIPPSASLDQPAQDDSKKEKGGGAMTRKDPTDFELMRFLWERAHAESTLFWTRNGVFVIVHPLAMSKVLELLVGEKTPRHYWPLGAIAVSAVVFSLIWVQMTYRGRKYAHAYLQDAKDIAHRMESRVPEAMARSLTTPNTSVNTSSAREDLRNLQFTKIGSIDTSTWVYVLAIWSVIAWAAIAVVSFWMSFRCGK